MVQQAGINNPVFLQQFARGPLNLQRTALTALNLQDEAKGKLIQARGAANLGYGQQAFQYNQEAQNLSNYANLFATFVKKFDEVSNIGLKDNRLSLDEATSLATIDSQPGISSTDFYYLNPRTYNPQVLTRQQLESVAYGSPLGGSGFPGGYGGGGFGFPRGGGFGGGLGGFPPMPGGGGFPGGYGGGIGSGPFAPGVDLMSDWGGPRMYAEGFIPGLGGGFGPTFGSPAMPQNGGIGFAPGGGFGYPMGGPQGGYQDPNGFNLNIDVSGYLNLMSGGGGLPGGGYGGGGFDPYMMGMQGGYGY